MDHRLRICVLALVCLVLCTAAKAENINQFWLAAQHDWSANRGFFLALEAPIPAGQPSRIEDVKLVLGVGDGSQWKFISARVDWKLDQKYQVKAVIKDGTAQLSIDGQRVANEPARVAPAAVELGFNAQPSFLRGPATYQVRETKLIARGNGDAIEPQLGHSALPPQLEVLSGGGVDESHQTLKIEDSVMIDAEFTFVAARSLSAIAPLVDRYGQAIAANWPAKVRDDADLKTADAEEAHRFAEWGEPTAFDAYGGLKSSPWKSGATGFYRVVTHGGKWWLITPTGLPCFYTGLCDAPALDWEATPVSGREFLFSWLPPQDGQFASAWRINPWQSTDEAGAHYLAWQTVNLIRKFGPDWQTQGTQSAVRRAKALGFNGFGKWSSAGCGVPDLPVLNHARVPNLAGHPDVFDPKIQAAFEQALRQQIEPRLKDASLLGWSVGNEKEECIAPEEITKILAMPDDVPAKQAFIQYAQSHGGTSLADTEALRRFYAERYYNFIYKTVKAIDPNHLYFGMWVTPNWWVNDGDWAAVAPNCDVIGYDFYALRFDAEPMGPLIAANDKPVLCGEFSAPPHYDGARGFGRYHINSADDAAAGEVYKNWLTGAAKNRNCVGVMYFQYRDQPITGRGPGLGDANTAISGEDYAFGIVDVT
ncbi:MAG TPA: hypothetical protein VLI90_20030, partial [Tepidisphaeraceae bacterium]|nr:hypothetical protein [Tepidisphaeraceae bacterium]